MLDKNNLYDGIKIAIELKTILINTCNPQLADNKEEKMIKIRDLINILNTIDWQNIDVYLEGKNSLEVDMLKRVLLAMFQLLAELKEIITNSKPVHRREGKQIN